MSRSGAANATGLNDYCVAMSAGGATMEEIGAHLGVTRQRVQQRLAASGVRVGNRNRSVDPIRAVAVARSTGFTSFCDVANTLGVNEAYLRVALVALGFHASLKRLYRLRRWVATRPRRDALAERLRAEAARLGRTPFALEVQAWGLWGDCYTLYGNVGNAVRAAGLTPNRTGRRPKSAPSSVSTNGGAGE